MKYTKQTYTLLFLGAITLICIICMMSLYQSPSSNAPTQRADMRYTTHDLRHHHLAPNDDHSMVLTGRTIESNHYNTQLTQPRLTWIQHQHVHWDIHADHATHRQNTQTIQLRGHINVYKKPDTKKSAIVLTTDQLNVDSLHHYAYTSHPVQIVQNNIHTVANGADIDFDHDRIVLHHGAKTTIEGLIS